MNVLRSVAMAFAMFSRVPMPRVEWKSENMQYMLAFFPLVGAVAGILLRLWALLCSALSLGPVLFAAGMTLLPVAVTGGIHLDGLCDTADSLASHGPPEKKRAILKDSHTGAFAVITLCSYLLLSFALYTELQNGGVWIWLCCLIPVMSRTASGFAGVCFPVHSDKGMLSAFHGSARKRAAVIILCVFFAAGVISMAALSLFACLAMTAALVLSLLYVYLMSRRQFGGMSGDLSGFLLQIAELSMLAGLILIERVVTL